MSLLSAATALATATAEQALTDNQRAARDTINMVNAGIAAAAGRGQQLITFRTLDVAKTLINRYGTSIDYISGIDLSSTALTNIQTAAGVAGYAYSQTVVNGSTYVSLTW